MIERRERCDGCGTTRPLAELLVCRSRLNPDRHPFYVCRPTLPGALKSCFGRAGTADQVEIALAAPPAPPGAGDHPSPTANRGGPPDSRAAKLPGFLTGRDRP